MIFKVVTTFWIQVKFTYIIKYDHYKISMVILLYKVFISNYP